MPVPDKKSCTIPRTRTTIPVLLSLLPVDLAKLDRIEAATRRGPRPNRSDALRVVLDAFPDPAGAKKDPRETLPGARSA